MLHSPSHRQFVSVLPKKLLWVMGLKNWYGFFKKLSWFIWAIWSCKRNSSFFSSCIFSRCFKRYAMIHCIAAQIDPREEQKENGLRKVGQKRVAIPACQFLSFPCTQLEMVLSYKASCFSHVYFSLFWLPKQGL